MEKFQSISYKLIKLTATLLSHRHIIFVLQEPTWSICAIEILQTVKRPTLSLDL